MQNTLQTLGRRMRAAREKAGVSQTEIAKILGVAKQTVSQWERGAAPPMITNLVRFASIMKIDVADLLRDTPGVVGETDASMIRVAAASRVVPLFSISEAGRLFSMDVDARRAAIKRTARRYMPVSVDHPPGSVAIEIQDRSMSPRFRPGDLISLVELVDELPEPGLLVFAQAGKELVFRRFEPTQAGTSVGARLVPFNKAWPVITMTEDDRLLAVMHQALTSYHDE